MEKKWDPETLLVGVWTGVATVENIKEILKKLKIQTTVWTIYSTSECLSESNTNSKGYVPPYVQYYL